MLQFFFQKIFITALVLVGLTCADHAPALNPFSRSPNSQFEHSNLNGDIDALSAPPAFGTPAPAFTSEVAPIFRNNNKKPINNGGNRNNQGAIDFSKAQRTADGRLCVIKDSSVETLAKDPILECTHKNVQKCHYTYVTQFEPAQEEVCEENFEKV